MLEKRTFVTFTQCKGRYPTCCKTRLESIDFVSLESPALTKRYAFLLAQLCEIAPVSRAAELMEHNKMTLWRADLERMRRLFEHYRVPQDLTHLSVDEVYAKGHHEEEENRSDRFFTIITDLKSRKPVWIEQSRSKEAMDAFFAMIGEVMKDNEAFYTLELIKERMISFFDEKTEEDAEKVFMELKKWICDAEVPELKRWWLKTAGHWETMVNYFTFRVTTAVSEGVNNVIKSLKRSAFGYRNMEYFRLKILQRCGYLNSKYMTENGQWTPAALSLMETGVAFQSI